MDKLQKCAKAFEKLLEIQYRIIIGRKGKTVELVIGFSKLDFHHLMGLGKLKDLRIAKQNRGSVFDEIIIGSTTYETLAKSRYLPQIENRFEPLALIEQLLDDNRLVFRYNAKLNQFSLIEADYLLSTPLENSDIYIFIAEHKDTGKYFCRSFFPKEKKDYTEGQPRYTINQQRIEFLRLPAYLIGPTFNAVPDRIHIAGLQLVKIAVHIFQR